MQTQTRTIEAVIFDLDGTLVDSEPLYLEADQQVFASYGVAITTQGREKYVGAATSVMLEDLVSIYHLDVPVDELLRLRILRYRELARSRSQVFPEMRKLVLALKTRGIPLAVASGSSQEEIDLVLSVTAIRDDFQVLLSSDQVKNGKPAPDIFLEAARQLSVSPQNCLVVEDSRHGVEAAKSAGMECIAVPYQNGGPIHPGFFRADLVFEKGMSEFSAEKAMQWILGRDAGESIQEKRIGPHPRIA